MIGFESTKSALLNSYQNNKLHHAILLHGKKGCGKASFARELAEEILGGKIESHPDLFLIEKDAEKKKLASIKFAASPVLPIKLLLFQKINSSSSIQLASLINLAPTLS